MIDGKDIHPDFTEELQKEGESFGFVYNQVEEWINFGLQPTDADFASYLGERGYTVEEVEENELEELKIEYNEVMTGNISSSFGSKKTIFSNEDGKDIHPSFTPELINTGKILGFTYHQVSEGINVGINSTDSDFCAGLRDIKKIDTEQVLNYSNYEQLQNEYQQHYSLILQQVQK